MCLALCLGYLLHSTCSLPSRMTKKHLLHLFCSEMKDLYSRAGAAGSKEAESAEEAERRLREDGAGKREADDEAMRGLEEEEEDDGPLERQ